MQFVEDLLETLRFIVKDVLFAGLFMGAVFGGGFAVCMITFWGFMKLLA